MQTATGIQDRMDQLETHVDQIGLAGVLLLLSDLCNEKAQHVATNWQDRKLAHIWQRNAAKLCKLANQVEPTY